MIKRISDFLAGLPMTIAAGVFLLFDLIPHLTGGNERPISFFLFDPAWVTVIISGIPLLYLAIWRVIHNSGISKISSALLICIAMFAATWVDRIKRDHDLVTYDEILAYWHGEPVDRDTEKSRRERLIPHRLSTVRAIGLGLLAAAIGAFVGYWGASIANTFLG